MIANILLCHAYPKNATPFMTIIPGIFYHNSCIRQWVFDYGDNSPNIKWKLVFGHHPIYTGGKRIAAPETKELNQLLKPIFDKYKVDAYICGHEHSLQYMQPSGSKTNYFISGAGSETTPSLLYPDGGKFALSENGFIGFSITPETMFVQIINFQGQVLYKDIIKK
jgi:tartrate-resistant acid phosphatase type 5